MKASVSSGSLDRWQEELSRIKVSPLRSLFTSRMTVRPGALPNHGGIYCFWWTGPVSLLDDPLCNRHIELVGPAKRPVILHFDDDWLGVRSGLPIPLYVGKAADSLARRTSDHLLMTRPRVTPMFTGHKKQERPTTSCQTRAGVEHLFPQLPDSRDLILDNLGLSWVELDGDVHAGNRFYLEVRAIGLMRPILNIDIER